MKTLDEKRAFATEAERALTHDAALSVMRQTLRQLGLPNTPATREQFAMMGSYIAQIARAQALGEDLEEYVLTDEERAIVNQDESATAGDELEGMIVAVMPIPKRRPGKDAPFKPPSERGDA